MVASAVRATLLAFGVLFFAGSAYAQKAEPPKADQQKVEPPKAEAPKAEAPKPEPQKIEIASKGGTRPFTVELARTDEERSRGLMFRKDLPDGTGMLFDFKQEQEVGFWMKNTYIPLDMIFIRADGTIRRIAANTEPLSERTVPSGGAVRYVLEVMGGTAKKLGIEVGDKVTGALLH
jgi:uncharacterized membrane protein (UPF0127 family)